MSENKFNHIEEIEEISGSLKKDTADLVVEETKRLPANQDRFDSLIHKDSKETAVLTDRQKPDSQKASLMDEVRDLNAKTNHLAKATPTELAEQARGVIAQIEDVKAKLTTPDLELKGSVQTLLKNKLSHIDESLKVALSRAGTEYATSEQPKQLTNPIERFLGFLTHGQYQLQRLARDVEMMHINNKEISPANMLAIQIKVGYIQNEIELFTNLLNKALESTKTIMNVQV